MVIGIKDAAKLIGIIIIAFCAALVCTMFMNYYIDLNSVKDQVTSDMGMILFNASLSTAKVVCAVSGGCLCLTSVVMLMFYCKHYIDTHKKELGILKALGYSNFSISRKFCIFGSSVFLGTSLGFAAAFLIMPSFYDVQNEDKLLPDMAVNFHPSLLLYLVVLPSAAFSVIAVCYSWYKLTMPLICLLKDQTLTSQKAKKHKFNENSESLFLDDLKKGTLRSKKSLVFFILFASFCFSAMTQMSFSMKELSSFMMGAMIMLIGLTLAFTTLFIALTSVINGNKKTIAMMRVFGYSSKECKRAIFSCYRPISYIGFAIGTVYQYMLLRIMVNIVFKDMEGIPEYKFDFPVMLVSLAAFIIVYEAVMYFYSEKIKKISVKEIMTE